MIFHKITLNNLFSYKGEQVFAFRHPADESRRLTLIMGRNGYGKTSLLNAVKLVFLGSDDKAQRQVGFPPVGLTRNAYILGKGTKWAGIMNRQARGAAETDCSVKVELGTPDEVLFVIERRWEIRDGAFDEFLEVNVDGRAFAGSEGELRLDEFLPRELVPFFFFDGEEIQFLAEASDIHRSDAMERLLSLSFINGVEAQLAELIKAWRREELPEEVQAKIREIEGRLDAGKGHIDAAFRKEQELANQERELLEEAALLQHRMDGLRKSGILSAHSTLDEEIKSLEAELQQDQSDIAYSLATDAPLVANPSLVKSGIKPLHELIERKSRAAQSVIDTLFRVLPERVFEEPPQPRVPLTDEQQKFYISKLRKLLDAFGIEDEPSNQFMEGIDVSRARQLFERFLGMTASIATLRDDRARQLREITRKKKLLEERRSERRESEFGSSEGAEQYEKLESQYAEKQQEVGELRAQLDGIRKQKTDREKEQQDLKKDIREHERERTKAESTGKRLGIAAALREAFRHYKQRRRESKREQIEESLNEHFTQLMSGHSLIDKIKIDEDFFLTYLDKSGVSIGHSTISHGMRQLVVTSLLWALKEVAGRSLPVIVDTPLARIDRENQENLLHHYYPNAAEQVIVLATDSEIDERKFELIRPQLVQVLKLINPDGESSTIEEIAVTDTAAGWEAVVNG